MAAKKLSVRKSLVFSLAQKYTTFVFNFASIVIVSRLLTPKEIGIFSVAVGLTTLANLLRTFGISDYLVQEKHLTEQMIRTSFTVNLIFAWILTVIIFLVSWPVGTFFDDAGVGQVLRVMSASFILVPFGITAMALLRRDMAFGVLYKINTSSQVVSSLATIGLAYAGFSYMSMAWASLASMAVMVLGCAIWAPEYRVRGTGLSGWRKILPFGAKMTLSDIATQLGQQSANLVVGKMLGLADAGFYSRGYGAVNMFRDKVVAAISAVAYPAFAAEHRETGMAPQLFLRSLVYLTGISWPFFVFSALMAFPMIRIMFGNQWDAAVPLMRWLCCAAIIGTLIYQCNQLFVAVGRVGAATVVEIQYQLARLVIAVVAALWSVEAVAASQILVYVIAAVLYYRKISDFDALKVRKCARALVPSVIAALGAGVAPAIVLFWPGFVAHHLVSGLVVAGFGAAAGWLLAMLAVKHPLVEEMQRVISRLRGYLESLQRRRGVG
jgi:O-antigen/teichoic acid export membrane protein